jgi:hypothetical protein
MDTVTGINELIAAKLAPLKDLLASRAAVLWPYLLFLLWLTLVGAYEGNDWRRQRLYAGYYRLISLASVVCFLVTFAVLALWMAAPTWLPLQTLTLSLTLPCFALGWSAMAGRPVMR